MIDFPVDPDIEWRKNKNYLTLEQEYCRLLRKALRQASVDASHIKAGDPSSYETTREELHAMAQEARGDEIDGYFYKAPRHRPANFFWRQHLSTVLSGVRPQLHKDRAIFIGEMPSMALHAEHQAHASGSLILVHFGLLKLISNVIEVVACTSQITSMGFAPEAGPIAVWLPILCVSDARELTRDFIAQVSLPEADYQRQKRELPEAPDRTGLRFARCFWLTDAICCAVVAHELGHALWKFLEKTGASDEVEFATAEYVRWIEQARATEPGQAISSKKLAKLLRKHREELTADGFAFEVLLGATPARKDSDYRALFYTLPAMMVVFMLIEWFSRSASGPDQSFRLDELRNSEDHPPTLLRARVVAKKFEKMNLPFAQAMEVIEVWRRFDACRPTGYESWGHYLDWPSVEERPQKLGVGMQIVLPTMAGPFS